VDQAARAGGARTRTDTRAAQGRSEQDRSRQGDAARDVPAEPAMPAGSLQLYFVPHAIRVLR